MPELTVYIIRHAEKPIGKKGQPGAVLGVDVDGSHSSHSLIVRGWQRAGGLAQLFAHNPGGNPLRAGIAQPDVIYATAYAAGSADGGDLDDADGGDDSKSMRPQYTVTPLNEKIRVPFITIYKENAEAALAADVVARAGTVLICWHHGTIPALATAIGGGAIGIPNHWKCDCFDRIWVLTRDNAGAWAFSRLPQYLLPGDGPV